MVGEKYSQTDVNGWTPELLKQRRRRALIMALALAGLVGMQASSTEYQVRSAKQ